MRIHVPPPQLAGGGRARSSALEANLTKRFREARRRERYRNAVGTPLTMDDLRRAWKRCRGRCMRCGVKLTWKWDRNMPPLEGATVDRIESHANQTYGGGNARFLCFGCNTERSGWEVADRIQRDLDACAKRVRALTAK